MPNINQQVKQMLQDINAYKVYKTDNEKNNTKHSIEKPYFKKNPKEEPGKPDYNSFLRKSKKGKSSNNKRSNKSSNKESEV